MLLLMFHLLMILYAFTRQDPFTAATKKKNEGNAAFKKAKYAEAIEKYTEAISLCPVDFKQELSTFHQNKAAAYEKLV